MAEHQQLVAAPHADQAAEVSADATVQHSLVVGVADIPAKEQVLLRSLLKVMDGKDNLRLRFSETTSECNVVLVPANWSLRLPPTCVSVHLIPQETPADAVPHQGLSIRAPLRLSNTSILLQAAAELLAYGEAIRRSSSSLALLLTTLLQHTMSRERRTTVLPLLDGREITLHFRDDCYYSPMPVDELLKGRYTLKEPRRASDAEITALSMRPSYRLRELLWLATNRLVDTGEPSVMLSGQFRLRRWPDAMALTRPGFPLLASLLTRRPHTIEQAALASGVSAAAIGWFLKTNLALGLAEVVEVGEEVPPVLPPVAATATPAKSMLSRIRDRLKLW